MPDKFKNWLDGMIESLELEKQLHGKKERIQARLSMLKEVLENYNRWEREDGEWISVLSELVRLKEIKDRLGDVERENQDQKFVNEYAEYVVAKRLAWLKAKQLVLSLNKEPEFPESTGGEVDLG